MGGAPLLDLTHIDPSQGKFGIQNSEFRIEKSFTELAQSGIAFFVVVCYTAYEPEGGSL
jgi:hypothetical protein